MMTERARYLTTIPFPSKLRDGVADAEISEPQRFCLIVVHQVKALEKLRRRPYSNRRCRSAHGRKQEMASNNTKAAITPVKFAHVVLRTNKINQLRDFYLDFLGASLAFEEHDVMVLIRYDDEHHRIGIINMPDIADKVKASSGLEVHCERPTPAYQSANKMPSILPLPTPLLKSLLRLTRRGKNVAYCPFGVSITARLSACTTMILMGTLSKRKPI
jgi:hypothetical protein